MVRNLWIFVIVLLLSSNLFSNEKHFTPTYQKSSISHSGLSRLTGNSLPVTETMKILAIRVEFQTDNDRLTSGNGKFDLSDTSAYFINPPPHDKAYFEHQLSALADYFHQASGGKLTLESEVYPEETDKAYLLPNVMGYYNPDTDEQELDQRLAELFRDSFQAADAGGNIDFSAYDSYMIFHAGVGGDYTFDLETTPKDIPSVFLNLDDLKNTIGANDPGFQGITVTNSIIKEGMILPETQNQLGFDIGLLGTMTIMFGHQLGLPNLYDSDTGRPGIGLFGVMDQGSANFLGLLPAHPCAWSKVFLGWEEPITVNGSAELQIAAALASNPDKIYKIPVTADEYFLLENRQRHVLRERDTTVGYDASGTRVEFKIRDDGSMEITPESSQDTIDVIVSVEEYDFGLPGSGILIWHIDERVIRERYHENRVNADMDRRGVDLVEADGAQDIGHFYNFFGITGYESGSRWDMWWDDNEAHTYANESENVLFSNNTMPDNRSRSGANTDVTIRNFSSNDAVMTCSLSREIFRSNFPKKTFDDFGSNSLVVGDVAGDNHEEIIAVSLGGRVYGWNEDGSKVIGNSETITSVDVKGDTSVFELALMATVDDSVLHTPALADIDGDSDLEIIIGTKGGRILVYQGTDNDVDGKADLLLSYDTEQEISTSLMVMGNAEKKIISGHVHGDVTIIDANGALISQRESGDGSISGLAAVDDQRFVVTARESFALVNAMDGTLIVEEEYEIGYYFHSPVIGDLDGDGEPEIVVNSDMGVISVFDLTGRQPDSFDGGLGKINNSRLALADLENDGLLEIVVSGSGYLFAYKHNGVLLNDFPVLLDRDEESTQMPEPLIADIDGDMDAEIINMTNAGFITANHHNGESVDGFPIAVDENVHSVPMLSDLDKDGKLNLSLLSADGDIYAFDLMDIYSADRVYWQGYRNDVSHSGRVTGAQNGAAPASELLPESSVYNYPNPTEGDATTIRYYLGSAADVTIRIYDLAGEFIREMSGTGHANMHNEVSLNLKDFQSGVYLVRVEAESADNSSISFFKMAVVK
jgi:M6 family metalloprotease-like protein